MMDLMNLETNAENNYIPYKRVDPEFINPFALGHKINHPPPDTASNVILLDMVIPDHFFPQDYMKYLPYLKYSHDHVNIQLFIQIFLSNLLNF